jgi:hypothetical protein
MRELLLCDPSPALRLRVLTELFDLTGDDPEVADLARRRLRSREVTQLLATEERDLKGLAWQLCRLAYLGIDRGHKRVGELAEAVFAQQLDDGSFPLRAFRPDGTYSMMPLQVSLPLRGLAAAGYGTDPRAERAYEWLLAQRLDDGSWPTARAAGQPGYVAGYRKLPGSAGCRANTQAALACLAEHLQRARSEPARRALNLLPRRETRDEWALGTEVARRCGLEPPAGFLTFYARFDLAFVLELASGAGASTDDERVAELVAFLESRRGPAGLWQHPVYPELSRWLTFDLSLSLRRLATGDWAGLGPRSRFRAYPAPARRY